MFFIRRGAGFEKAFRYSLHQKNFEVRQKISEDIFEVSCENINFHVDVTEIRRFYGKRDNAAFERFLLQIELDFASKRRLVSFANAQNSLRCLLMRGDELDEDWISSPFVEEVNFLKILAFTADNENIIPLSLDYIKKWSVPRDVLFAVADRNMCEILRKTELYVSTIAGKIKVIEFPVENTKLRAAMMLCSNFRKLVSEKLGTRFLVIAPSRESMLAVEDVTNDVIECFGPVVLQEYQKSESKLSTDVFLFSPKGISIAGKFNIPEKVEVTVG